MFSPLGFQEMSQPKRERLFPIIINSSGLVDTPNNNIYRYRFPAGSVVFNNARVAIQTINIYYSWFNITSEYNNNQFSIVFPTLAGSTTLNITIPDGFYDIDSLNAYLQQIFITNGLYLVNSTSDNVYYAEFKVNPSSYSIQFNSYPVPTALPMGWTNPAGMTFPLVASTPLLIVPNNNFTKIIGFNAGTYPAVFQPTTYSKTSDFTPQVSPVQSVVLACSLLNNKYSNPNTILYTFSPEGTPFGSVISSSPNYPPFVDIQNGNYNEFEIRFLDQNFNDLKILDTNLIVQLMISIIE
jgi:hypothetical protein